jgi:ADP-ribose pyrophosphatase YjhB (NUDIX family)
VKVVFDSAAPYIACFTVLRRGNKVACILRKNTKWMDGYWGLPAGKVEWGEPYKHGAAREAKEEAGVTVAVEDVDFLHACHRHADDTDWVDVYFEAKKWHGEPYNAEEDKGERLEWLDLTTLPDNVVPSQRFVLEKIAQGVPYSEFGWDSK